MNTYTPVVGIEIHVELRTASKMFCGCTNDPFHANEPNIHTCPVCLGMPGALPVANKKAIEWTIKIGLALGCTINLFSKFDRKHYFYPDLPKGYQISQYDQPLCVGGLVSTEFGDVRITRVHLEEDTGKLLHKTIDGRQFSLVDFNRSGVPLVEIVTEPDIHSPEQAKAYAKKIAQIIKHLEVSDADMEKGSMRLEANISVRTADETLPPYKVEVKNLNSFRYIERAIAYETKRQGTIRDAGDLPTQETRGWNETKNETFPQRSKESAEDYRYFPDPDLPPLRFAQAQIDHIRSEIPDLPEAFISRWIASGIKAQDARVLANNRHLSQIISALVSENADDRAKLASQLVNKKILLDSENGTIQDSIADLRKQSAALTETIAVSDEALEQAIAEVISEQPKAVEDYRAGKQQVLGFLIGMVKKKVGSADTTVISAKLRTQL